MKCPRPSDSALRNALGERPPALPETFSSDVMKGIARAATAALDPLPLLPTAALAVLTGGVITFVSQAAQQLPASPPDLSLFGTGTWDSPFLTP